MKRSWIVIALVLSVGVNIGVLATIGMSRARSQRPDLSRGERWEGRRGSSPAEHLAERLDLAEGTREAFLEQHRQFYESLQATRRELGETRRALREEVGSSSPSRERIDELLDRSAVLTVQMERAFVDNVIATRALLDEDQQSAYLKFLSRMRDRGDRSRRRPDEGPPRPPLSPDP